MTCILIRIFCYFYVARMIMASLTKLLGNFFLLKRYLVLTN